MTPPAPQPFQRRVVYIKKDFQLRFILTFCAVVAGGAGLSALALYHFSGDTITSTFHNSRLAIQTTSQVILPAILYTALVNVVIAGAAVAGISLYNSHKIAGPLHRFELELRKMAGGDFSRRIHLRERDQLTDLAAALNDVLAGLDGGMLRLREEAEAARRAVSALREAGRVADCPELARLDEALDRLAAEMDARFRTSSRPQTAPSPATPPEPGA